MAPIWSALVGCPRPAPATVHTVANAISSEVSVAPIPRPRVDLYQEKGDKPVPFETEAARRVG
jgi:hypothetical protein